MLRTDAAHVAALEAEVAELARKAGRVPELEQATADLHSALAAAHTAVAKAEAAGKQAVAQVQAAGRAEKAAQVGGLLGLWGRCRLLLAGWRCWSPVSCAERCLTLSSRTPLAPPARLQRESEMRQSLNTANREIRALKKRAESAERALAEKERELADVQAATLGAVERQGRRRAGAEQALAAIVALSVLTVVSVASVATIRKMG